MPGKERTPTERAIIYLGVLGGLSIEHIDKLLKPLGADGLDPTSYAMLKGTYFSKMLAGIGNTPSTFKNDFGEWIYHPKPMGDI